jgi:hypothetical protein
MIAGLPNCISAQKDLKDGDCDCRAKQPVRHGLARLVTKRKVTIQHTARFCRMPKNDGATNV